MDSDTLNETTMQSEQTDENEKSTVTEGDVTNSEGNLSDEGNVGSESEGNSNSKSFGVTEETVANSIHEKSQHSEKVGNTSESILDVNALFSDQPEEGGEGVIVGELEVDLGNLLVFDHQNHPKNVPPVQHARNAMQELFNQVFNQPAKQSEAGPVANLPRPKTSIPREKPLPKDKPSTRWEKFAKEKGIKKRKRERLIYDEETKDYLPRWGRNRANNPLDDIVKADRPAEMQKYGAEDPFILEKMKKQERVQRQKKREDINRRRAVADDAKDLPATVDITTNAPRRQKHSIEKALQLAQKSTASLGRFDKLHSDEPAIKRKPKFAPLNPAEEHKHNLKMVERVLKKTNADALDVDRAATLHIRDEQRKAATNNRNNGSKKRKAPPSTAKNKKRKTK